jgi:hypothetical protein
MRADPAAMADRWSGWIGFAAWLLIIIGFFDAIEGLIAIIRGSYYVLTPNQIIIFDLKTWGWITLIWAVVVFFAGWGLLSAATWARWFAIVVVTANTLLQLGFLGATQYTLWTLTVITLSIIVLYGLIVRWGDYKSAA